MTKSIQAFFGLTGKVAIVTGSTKGIGLAILEGYAKLGARTVVSSRKADSCEAVAERVRSEGAEVISVPCNISCEEDLKRLVETTLETWGRIDILVCNAAVNPYYGPLTELNDEAYRKTMDTNVLCNLRLASLVRPSMASRKDGSIIIVSSIAGVQGSANLGIYALTKAADMQLARSLAVEFGPDNIRVNCIAPGLVRTDFARRRWENNEHYRKVLKSYPLGRIGEPEDMVGAAVLLAGAAGSFITGQTYFVDGGVTIGGG